MKIRRLEIQGFKSFADRTVFDFGAGISAIVGPNGCGKSNVVDALKWVLGDMSPRSLRGKKMEDVIFAGSRHRRALGLAAVTLVLDNESGLLRTERTEVSITRRLHRSGLSEYLIGGEAARLKDIRELFLDTGLGVEGSSIMEQGQIDALLAASPADRRGIFEEAAGISRYKQRRKEAEQRLHRTEENLERLLDVLELEEKRLRSLKNQAGRARRYQEIREELSKKRVLRGVLRYRRLARERSGVGERLGALLDEERRAAGELAAFESTVREAEALRTEAREAVHAEESLIAAAASDIRAAGARVEFATRTRDDLLARIETAAAEAEVARERRSRLRAEIADLDAEATEADERARREQERVALAERELSRLDAAAARVRDAHEGAKRRALEALGRISDAKNEEAEHRVEVRQARERLVRLGRRELELLESRDRREDELEALRHTATRLEEEARDRAERLGRSERTRDALREEAAEARRGAAAVSEKRATLTARRELLERLAAAHEGVDEGARAVLEEVADRAPEPDGARGGVFGVLADLLAPSPEGAQVLDRLLGPAAGALVVRTTADARSWIAWLRGRGEPSRARFLPLDLVREDAPPLPDAVGEIEAPEPLLGLVRSVAAGVRLVDDLEEATRRWREEGPLNAVTPRGDRVTRSGALLGGPDGEALGLVGRTAERRELAREIAVLAERLDAVRREAGALEERVEAGERAIAGLRHDIARQAEDRSRGGADLARVEKELSHVLQSLEGLALERRELTEQMAFAHEAAAVVGRRLAALQEQKSAIERQAEEAARGYLALETARGEASERRMEVRLALTEARATADGARGRMARAQAEIERLDERAASLDAERDDLRRRAERADVDIAEAEAEGRRREDDRRRAAETLGGARARLEELEREAGGELARKQELERLHEDLRGRLESFRVKDSELRVRLEDLVEQVRSDHDLDLESVARETEADESVDLDAVDAEVESLKSRLEGLGNVNLNAIAELEEVEAHVTTLHEQQKDLLDAKADLQKVIEELDRVSTTRFAETFEQVREHFRETFRRLFGGGRADIVLEDASDLLESGIDIVARPPGKEQRTISLLSGGERTLTAVALLFAVFKARPSPFTVLDEVDAALDEANVRRLIALVREFTDRSQFLIVTHAKTTMEAADILFGVTMEEPGVSKRVAVQLTEYAVAAG